MQENVKQVIVKMTARRAFRTEPIYQYDVGHVLTFEGFDLPMSFEVHFSRSPMGNAIPQIGTDGTCTVPDMYTQSAGVIYAWLYIADTDTGLTKYSIEIPVAKRAKPTNQEPTPVEQSAIDQAIAALNAGVERSETAADAAESAQEAAEGYAEAAGNSAITATNAASAAASAKTAAETAARNAATSATDAHTSREVADQSATNAGVSERAAASSASAAAGSATSAAASAGQASASATAASGSASTASTKASEAAQSATDAAGSAASASDDAGTASTAATAAEASATAAAGSATAAAGSATSAGQSATAAAGSASDAAEIKDYLDENYGEISDDVNSLKSALNNTDVDIEKIKDATVTKIFGSDIAYTENEEGGYWRFINGAWQKVKTSGVAYWHMVTYPVTAGKIYRITGWHTAYCPLATFWTNDGTVPFAYTPDGYSSTQANENITLDVIVPDAATKMIVSVFPLGTFPTVKEISYENSMSVAQKIADQVFYCTFDQNYVSFAKNGNGLDITLPYRFYVHYLKSKASEVKTLASTGTVTYNCPHGSYLVFDLNDNTVKIWYWADISSASKDNYILFATITNGKADGGILKPYFNEYRIGLIESENYSKTLKNIRESGLGVNFDTGSVKFEMTETGLDITFPYRCFIFGDKTNNIYQRTLNGLSTGVFTISWNLSGYVILDITTGNVSVVDWAGISNYTNPFIVLASSGKRVAIDGIYYPFFGDGVLLPYYNQYVLSVLNGIISNGRVNPPYYYFLDDYLPNKAVSIRNKAKNADVSFGFVTDYHVGFNMRRSMLLMKYLADKTNAIPFVLFGGDVPKATGTEEEALAAGDSWLEDASVYGKENVYQCKGNHDYMINTSDSTSFHADVKTDYYYICKPTEHKVHGSPDRLYYYFDDDVNMVRYIVLDNYDAGYASGNYNSTGMSQAQYDWLIDLLNTNGYDILVLSHQTSDATLASYESVLEPLQVILKAFVAKGALSYSGNGVSLSADFSGNTSRLICHLSGHSHNDESHVDSGVLSIVSVCDAYYSQPSGYNRGYSAINEQAFDVFCITKESRTIDIVRVGAGNDRQFTY